MFASRSLASGKPARCRRMVLAASMLAATVLLAGATPAMSAGDQPPVTPAAPARTLPTVALPLDATAGATPRVRELIGPAGLAILAAARSSMVAPMSSAPVVPAADAAQEQNGKPGEAPQPQPQPAVLDSQVNWARGTRLSRRQTERLVAIFLDEKTFLFNSQKRCVFVPACGCRLESPQGSVTVLFCFGCTEVMFLVRDARGTLVHEAVEDFDYARTELLAILRELLPDMQLLRGLPSWRNDVLLPLGELAREAAGQLEARGEEAVRFSGLTGSEGSRAAGALSRELQRQLDLAGLKVGRSRRRGLSLHARLQLAGAPADAEAAPGSRARVQLQCELRDRRGKVVQRLREVSFSGPTAEYLLRGSPTVTWQERVHMGRLSAIVQASLRARPVIEGARVRAAEDSPFVVRLIAGREPWLHFVRVTAGARGELRADCARNQLESLTLENRSSHDCLARVRLPGETAARFTSPLPARPLARGSDSAPPANTTFVLVPAGRQITVTIATPPVAAGQLPAPLAPRAPAAASAAERIEIVFHAAWQAGKDLPPDDPLLDEEPPRAFFVSPLKQPWQQAGISRAAVSILLKSGS